MVEFTHCNQNAKTVGALLRFLDKPGSALRSADEGGSLDGFKPEGGAKLSCPGAKGDRQGIVRGANGRYRFRREAAARVWRGERRGDCGTLRYEHLPRGLHGSVRRRSLRAPRLPEESEAR